MFIFQLEISLGYFCGKLCSGIIHDNYTSKWKERHDEMFNSDFGSESQKERYEEERNVMDCLTKECIDLGIWIDETLKWQQRAMRTSRWSSIAVSEDFVNSQNGFLPDAVRHVKNNSMSIILEHICHLHSSIHSVIITDTSSSTYLIHLLEIGYWMEGKIT